MDRSRIPNRLKKYRRAADLSQRKVAGYLGLKNTSCISRWEKGLGMPGIMHLFQLSVLYQTMPNHLYFDVWESVKRNVLEKHQNLSAHSELFNSNETYLI